MSDEERKQRQETVRAILKEVGCPQKDIDYVLDDRFDDALYRIETVDDVKIFNFKDDLSAFHLWATTI
jgi:hypothetical protein